MPSTIRDVARRAGVSIATVSRVLNRADHPVRAEVRARVEAAARELDFRPSSLARGLAGRETRTLALVVPDIANPYYPRLSRGAEDMASRHGYAVIICNWDHRPEKLAVYVGLLREKRVDGILLAGGGQERLDDLAALAGGDLPIEAIGRQPLTAPSVRIDNVVAGRDATVHLIERGRRRIAYLGGPNGHTTAADRRAGFRQALEAAGLERDPDLEVEAGLGPEDGARAAAELIATRLPLDGLFAYNDLLAIGLVHGLVGAGRRVPEDVAVIGFDDIPLAPFVRPSLSSVAVPAYELGATAAERLISRLGRGRVDETIWLPTRVVARESSGG